MDHVMMLAGFHRMLVPTLPRCTCNQGHPLWSHLSPLVCRHRRVSAPGPAAKSSNSTTEMPHRVAGLPCVASDQDSGLPLPQSVLRPPQVLGWFQMELSVGMCR